MGKLNMAFGTLIMAFTTRKGGIYVARLPPRAVTWVRHAALTDNKKLAEWCKKMGERCGILTFLHYFCNLFVQRTAPNR